MATPHIRVAHSLRRSKGGVFVISILNFIIGAVTGIISGFGIGGGSLLVLYLTAISGTPQYTAGGINLLYFIGCAPAALVGHIKNKQIEWRATLWCAVSGIIVAIPTALLADGIDGDWLRRLFGILLLFVGIRELKCSPKKNNR